MATRDSLSQDSKPRHVKQLVVNRIGRLETLVVLYNEGKKFYIVCWLRSYLTQLLLSFYRFLLPDFYFSRNSWHSYAQHLDSLVSSL